MKEGEREEDVDVSVEIPPNILKDLLDDSRNRKAEDSVNCRRTEAKNSQVVIKWQSR